MGVGAWIEQRSISALLLLGGALRVVMMLYSIFHDGYFRVKYTDIDYMIITDAAAEVVKGKSPFDRVTYRYTPLLSWLMIPNAAVWLHSGKLIFALCDIGAAYYCYSVLRTFATEKSSKIAVSVFILFNPIVVEVSTRGNSDILVTFLCMIVLAHFYRKAFFSAALWLGFAIHFKVYPIIYTAPLIFGLWSSTAGHTAALKLKSCAPTILGCGVLVAVGFAAPTLFCWRLYGQRYLDEALLYHISREDHRHNLSPYWLPMYLAMGGRALGSSEAYNSGLAAFIPQAIVLIWTAWRLRRNTAHAFCIETVIFVGFNKVCTVQYFVWFIPFLGYVTTR